MNIWAAYVKTHHIFPSSSKMAKTFVHFRGGKSLVLSQNHDFQFKGVVLRTHSNFPFHLQSLFWRRQENKLFYHKILQQKRQLLSYKVVLWFSIKKLSKCFIFVNWIQYLRTVWWKKQIQVGQDCTVFLWRWPNFVP